MYLEPIQIKLNAQKFPMRMNRCKMSEVRFSFYWIGERENSISQHISFFILLNKLWCQHYLTKLFSFMKTWILHHQQYCIPGSIAQAWWAGAQDISLIWHLTVSWPDQTWPEPFSPCLLHCCLIYYSYWSCVCHWSRESRNIIKLLFAW